ncbi:MAG TPA: CHAD domain-containing protein [Actinomycetota bacterium]|nr:CHAD domain-containing protein [Actinomycetota bacterium]
MTLERETKLRAPATFALPELSDVPGLVPVRSEPRRFATAYVDTQDLRLARWGCSLRHRAGEGWTLKLPRTSAGATVVREELSFVGEPRHVPAEASDLVAGYVRGAELRPVVRLRTVRRRVEVTDEQGAAIGEVVDDEVSVMDGSRVAARFRELEVEAAAPERDPRLEAVVSRLVVAGASPTDGTPKYLQALGARALAPPDVVVPELGPDASVGEVVRGAIAASVVRLIRHDAGVRLGDDLEDVHQARVATRRLRSDLRTFREVLDPEWDASLREELGWLGGELGTVRDLDVQLERLAALVETLPDEDRGVGDRLLAERDRRRDDARTHLLEAMRSDRYLALLDRLVEDARDPAVLADAARAPAAMALATVMDRPWKHLKAAMEELGPASPDADLHLARIRTKRVRYAAEAVEPVFGRGARGFARAAAALQDVLGEHQDAVVGAAWLREASRGGGRRAFVAGQLVTLERFGAASARHRWPGDWKRLARKRLRFWA